MNTFTVLVICIFTAFKTHSTPDSTLPVRARVALLKRQIATEIENSKKQHEKQQNDASESFENLEYVDIEKEPITPINENDERKKNGRFHLRQLRTTTEKITLKPTRRFTRKSVTKKIRDVKIFDPESATLSEIFADDISSKEEQAKHKLQGIDKILYPIEKPQKSLREEKINLTEIAKTSNIFYRRIYNIDFKRCTKEVIHCTDLITPILTGQRTNITDRRILTYKDNEVIRLLELLNEDTTGLSKEDVYAHLYQISNLQIRLFQWDVSSIKMLFNVLHKGIDKEHRHTWKSLKRGLKRLLNEWHMDFSNVTNLLLQARIFRPPCIADDFTGSTQSPRVSHYTSRKAKLKKKCADRDDPYTSSCEMP